MKVLLDECLPRRLKIDLPGHTVFTVLDTGWSGTKDGPLLRLAERAAFEAFVSVDASLAFPQNLRSVVLRFVVLRELPTIDWRHDNH
jgi:hypothetical protein